MSELPIGPVTVLVLEMQRLRDEVARLTAELAERTRERDEALRCSRLNCDLYRQATERGEKAEKEHDGLAAAMERAPMLAVKAIVDYCRVANRRCGIELQDAVVLQMQQALSDPSAILAAHDATIKARAKAEGLREAHRRICAAAVQSEDRGETYTWSSAATLVFDMAEAAEGGKDA